MSATLTLGLMGASELAKLLGNRRSANKKQDFYSDLRRDAETEAKAARAKRDAYGLGSTYKKYLNLAMQDPISDIEREEARRRQGQAVGALKSGGAKALLGGLQAQSAFGSDDLAKIGAREDQRRTGALSTIASAEQRMLLEKLRDTRGDLTLARGQAASGLKGEFEAKQQKDQVGYDFASGLLGLGAYASNAGMLGGEEGEVDLDLLKEDGGKVKKTPGEFSHESNPLDVMQDGEKVAEMTGGEYVINPEQAKKIAKQSKFAAMLFKKFEKESA